MTALVVPLFALLADILALFLLTAEFLPRVLRSSAAPSLRGLCVPFAALFAGFVRPLLAVLLFVALLFVPGLGSLRLLGVALLVLSGLLTSLALLGLALLLRSLLAVLLGLLPTTLLVLYVLLRSLLPVLLGLLPAPMLVLYVLLGSWLAVLFGRLGLLPPTLLVLFVLMRPLLGVVLSRSPLELLTARGGLLAVPFFATLGILSPVRWNATTTPLAMPALFVGLTPLFE